MLLLSSLLVLVSFLGLILSSKWREKPRRRSVAIVVLGDIGRSPRMMYHAESFARIQFETWIIAYRGSRPIASLLSLPFVRFVYLRTPPSFISHLPRVFFPVLAPVKVLIQTLSLIHGLLFSLPAPEFILVQNPPSLPTLAIVQMVAYLRHSKLIIDWHNLGYSIFALRLGPAHPLVKIYKWFESTFGRTAYIHLFVTKAMRDFLVTEWHLKGDVVVLHDRPPSHFHPCDPSEIHDLFLRITEKIQLPGFFPPPEEPQSTPFTHFAPRELSDRKLSLTPYKDTANVALRPDRPALVVSSTSWTPDEDFGLLLQALSIYEQKAREVNSSASIPLPKVLVIVTGRGPLKDKYMSEVARLEAEEEWQWVRCCSMWLEAEDYPLLLGSADLGVSLHSSSSGIDLPMKVVDMFGCCLPVCALKFACIGELVQDGKNGLLFSSGEQLAAQLIDLLTTFPNAPRLQTLRRYIVSQRSASWNDDSAPHVSRRHSPLSSSSSLSTFEKLSMSSSSAEIPIADEPQSEDGNWCTWAQNWTDIVRPLVVRDFDDDAKAEERWLDQIAELGPQSDTEISP